MLVLPMSTVDFRTERKRQKDVVPLERRLSIRSDPSLNRLVSFIIAFHYICFFYQGFMIFYHGLMLW